MTTISDDKIKITCATCGIEHERVAWHTWHQNLCDACITEWAREKAIIELDQAIDRAGDEAGVKRQVHALHEHLRIFKIWDTKT